jgi:hypothetical protein
VQPQNQAAAADGQRLQGDLDFGNDSLFQFLDGPVNAAAGGPAAPSALPMSRVEGRGGSM